MMVRGVKKLRFCRPVDLVYSGKDFFFVDYPNKVWFPTVVLLTH